MLALGHGKIIGKIKGGKLDSKLIGICDPDNECCKKHNRDGCLRRVCCKKCTMKYSIGGKIDLTAKFIPIPDMTQRGVYYVAGPSGSGKTCYSLGLINKLKKTHKKKPFYIFSRTDAKNDPAFKGVKGAQILIDETLIDDPIDIEKDIKGGSIVMFDDCNTIQNDKIRKAIEKLMGDIMEVGRKMDITIIITNHLVIPNERKFARTILNEMHTLTVFPKSGSSQQIAYVLKTYFGLSKLQIEELLKVKSRWLTITKTYPQIVMHEHGAFVL